MELSKAGISEQPFRTHGGPVTFVHYQGQLAAEEFLHTVRLNPCGLGLLQGPSLSGKSAIIQHFVTSLHEETAVAVIDGPGLTAKRMLSRIIKAYEFDLKLDSVTEQMSLLRVYAMQQAAMHEAPMLIIENAHALSLEALQILSDLATIEVGSTCALRIILSSDQALGSIVNAPGMSSLGSRLTGTFNLLPMNHDETSHYVHRKLQAAGCEEPGRVLPEGVCTELHKASGGWPGIVDRLMTLALAHAKFLPLSLDDIEHPVVPKLTGPAGLQIESRALPDITEAKLYLTYKGRTLREIPLDGERIILGRSDHNDIAISSRFISRHHALFIRDGVTTLLMDLNSTNGTFVNSRRVSNHIMVHDDVINLGHHGLKFCDPLALNSQPLHDVGLDETIIMKSVDDMRRRMARENTRVAQAASE